MLQDMIQQHGAGIHSAKLINSIPLLYGITSKIFLSMMIWADRLSFLANRIVGGL